MTTQPRMNVNLIDLTARVFNSHRKGLPEWMKNAREIYLRSDVGYDQRIVVINFVEGRVGSDAYLECIDFAGISGDDLHARYPEWGNPDVSQIGLKAGQGEGGQGNGGKAYLRQMFKKGFIASICHQKLSLMSFVDAKKYTIDFFPDAKTAKDISGDHSVYPLRSSAAEWLKQYKLPVTHNF